MRQGKIGVYVVGIQRQSLLITMLGARPVLLCDAEFRFGDVELEGLGLGRDLTINAGTGLLCLALFRKDLAQTIQRWSVIRDDRQRLFVGLLRLRVVAFEARHCTHTLLA